MKDSNRTSKVPTPSEIEDDEGPSICCSVRLDTDLNIKVMRAAKKMGMKRGTLMRVWVIEGLARELKKGREK